VGKILLRGKVYGMPRSGAKLLVLTPVGTYYRRSVRIHGILFIPALSPHRFFSVQTKNATSPPNGEVKKFENFKYLFYPNTMSTTLANTWESHFRNHPSNEASNKTLSQLFELFDIADQAEKCKTFALSEPDTLFLALAPISGHLLPFHHTTKIGGTRTPPNERFFTLVGTGTSAYPAQIAANDLFASQEPSRNPSWRSIMDATDPASLLNLPTNARSTSTPKRNFIPVPPFIASTIMPIEGKPIEEIIFSSVTKMKAFDAEHDGDNSFQKAAR
jgi:hypothetical protein